MKPSATDLRDPQPGVPVLPLAQIAEPTDAFERRTPHEHTRRIEHHVVDEETLEHPPRRLLSRVNDALALHLFVARVGVTADERDLRMPAQVRDLTLDLVRQPRVVRVEERHERSGGHSDAGVASTRGPDSRRTDIGHAAICIRSSDGRRFVGRAVVDDDDVERRIRLCENALDGPAQEPAVVVRRDDDAHDSRRVVCFHGGASATSLVIVNADPRTNARDSARGSRSRTWACQSMVPTTFSASCETVSFPMTIRGRHMSSSESAIARPRAC